AGAQFLRKARKATHLLGGQFPDWQHDADPMEAALALRMDADVGRAVEREPRHQRLARHARELAAKFLFDKADYLFKPQPVDDVFETRLGPVRAVAMIDEHAHDSVG